jgi:hypothetical protein
MHTNSMRRRLLRTLAVLLLFETNHWVREGVQGQTIGTDICACQPVTYELILNLSLSCADTTVLETIPGILDRACQVESRDEIENITNPFPLTIGSVIVSELDANLLPVSQAVYRGPYFDGDIITYTSIVLTNPNELNATTIPRGFQVVLTGLNSAEETLTNTWVITYENDCSIFPLLTKGEQIGWTIFVSRLSKYFVNRRKELVPNSFSYVTYHCITGRFRGALPGCMSGGTGFTNRIVGSTHSIPLSTQSTFGYTNHDISQCIPQCIPQ